MTMRDLLVAGRRRIAAGWCQGQYVRESETGAVHYCTIGALLSVTDYSVFKAVDALCHVCVYDYPDQTLAAWNDNPRRMKAEVVALYDRAIAAESGLAEAKEPTDAR